MTEREVVLIDMDCFYVQVEQRLNPDLKGKPCVVVQYNTWKGGGIIAVGYEARACGVTRRMRGDEAKLKCPNLHLARVPEVRGKADLTRYREAGAEVIAVFSKFCACVERASVDEAYLDISQEVSQRLKNMESSMLKPEQIPNTIVAGYEGLEAKKEWIEEVHRSKGSNECGLRLAIAASLVEELRAAVLQETGFTCSAGIAHNKMLSKLACGQNKPNKQTVVPSSSVSAMFATLPLQKIRHLGGKLGSFLTDELKLTTMGDLTRLTEAELQAHCGHKTGTWLYSACRGLEYEPVSARQLPKSIGCGKNFRGKEMLDTREKVRFWLSGLSKELSERLNKDKEMNKRTATSLTVYLSYQGSSVSSSTSRACPLLRYDDEKICSDAFAALQQFNSSPASSPQWYPPITNLSLTASKFSDQRDSQKISSLFTSMRSTQSSTSGSKLSIEHRVIDKEISEETRETLLSDSLCLSSVDSNNGDIESNTFKTSSDATDERFSLPYQWPEAAGQKTAQQEDSKQSCLSGGKSKKGKKDIVSYFSQRKFVTEEDYTCTNSAHDMIKQLGGCHETVSKGEISDYLPLNSYEAKNTADVGFFAKKLKQMKKTKTKSVDTPERSHTSHTEQCGMTNETTDGCEVKACCVYEGKDCKADVRTYNGEAGNVNKNGKINIEGKDVSEKSCDNHQRRQCHVCCDKFEVKMNADFSEPVMIKTEDSNLNAEGNKVEDLSSSELLSSCSELRQHKFEDEMPCLPYSMEKMEGINTNAALRQDENDMNQACGSDSDVACPNGPNHMSVTGLCQAGAGTNTETVNAEDFMECGKCGEFISMWEMPEHNDFHYAMELQSYSHKSHLSADLCSGMSNSGKSVVDLKTKRKSVSPTKSKKGKSKKKKTVVDKSVQPLTMFFSKT